MVSFVRGLMVGRRDAARWLRMDAARWDEGGGEAFVMWRWEYYARAHPMAHPPALPGAENALATLDAAFAATFGGA